MFRFVIKKLLCWFLAELERNSNSVLRVSTKKEPNAITGSLTFMTAKNLLTLFMKYVNGEEIA